MNANSVATHLAGALVAFALGWFLSSAGVDDSSTSASSPSAQTSNDPATALETILALDDPIDRAARLAAFLDRTDPSAALGLHEILQQKRSGLVIDETTEMLFASWWAQSDPETAFRNPVNPPWADRHPWMRTVLKEWARRDPVAAAYAVQAMPAGPLKGRIEGARTVVDEWLKLDEIPEPRALLGVIKQLEPIARSGAITHFVDSMIEDRGIDATLEFVRSIPPDELPGGSVQHEFLARTGVVLINHDIDRAIAWADEQADGPAGAGVQKHLAYYWALREGRPAMEWAIALPDHPAKSTVVKRAWISFSRKHREDASEWLRSRPPEPTMRGTYIEFIRDLAETEPGEAMDLADRTVDEALRNEMRAAAGQGWMKHDPTAATAWLATAALPAELETRVRAAQNVDGT
jgi:hypothetical protein